MGDPHPHDGPRPDQQDGADQDRPDPDFPDPDRPDPDRPDREDRPGRTRRSGRTGRPDQAEMSRTVVELTADDVSPVERRRLLGRLAGQAGHGGWWLLTRPRDAYRWMADTVLAVAPHLQIRDLETVRAHYRGLDGEELAERLVRNASRVSATVGAAGGGLSAVEWAAPPALLSAPVLLAAETVAVVAVELKLIGELHEVYRLPIPGTAGQRAVALVRTWATRRVPLFGDDRVESADPRRTAGRGLSASLGMAVRRELRDRLLRRFGRNLTTLGPLLTGAAVGAELNRRATRTLGTEVRDDLRAIARRPSLPAGG